jgi:hypothetical protein
MFEQYYDDLEAVERCLSKDGLQHPSLKHILDPVLREQRRLAAQKHGLRMFSNFNKWRSDERKRSHTVPRVQLIITLGGAIGARSITNRQLLPDENGLTPPNKFIAFCEEEFEEKAPSALLNEEPFQERFVLHVDGSVRKRATIERLSERERLVSYYLPEPSPKMQRRIDLDRAIRRAEEREAKEREAMERAAARALRADA